MYNKLIIALIAGSFALTANAATVQLRYASPDDVVTTKLGITGSPANGKNIYMGSYNLAIQSPASTFSGFCVDPYQWANSSFKTYNVSSLSASSFSNNGATRLQNAQKLVDNAYATLLDDDTKTAGFHLALWEIFHDDLNVNSGGIFGISGTNAAMLSYATGFLANLGTWQVKNDYKITFYQNATYQDYISVSQVPLPAALPLFASAFAGFGLMRRRKVS